SGRASGSFWFGALTLLIFQCRPPSKKGLFLCPEIGVHHNLFVQVAKEVQDLFLPHAPLVRPKVELPQSHPCSDGEVIPIELVLQDGRNAALGPCAHPMRSLAEAAFVYEDDEPALFLCFFLRAGHMFSFQSRMAASFRSRARPTGRWQLQPSFWRKIHHTWPE